MSLSVYFCASVAGGRKYQHIHPFIVDEIKQAATVINENIAQSGCHEKGVPCNIMNILHLKQTCVHVSFKQLSV